MVKKILLEKFKAENPRLVALCPIITVDVITVDKQLLKPEITVKHPFIFDNRLIPLEFNKIKVHNVIIGKFPKEFPEPKSDYNMPLFEYWHPEKYKLFVKNHLNLIRLKLKSPTMSKREALDALTGSFSKHVKWLKQNRKEFLKEYKWQDGTWQKLSRLEKLKKLAGAYKADQPTKRKKYKKTFLIDNNDFGKMLPGVE